MVQLAEALNKARREAVKTLEVELEACMESAKRGDAKQSWWEHGSAKAIMEEITMLESNIAEEGEVQRGQREAKFRIFREEIRRIQTPWHDHPLRRFLTALSSGSEERHAPR